MDSSTSGLVSLGSLQLSEGRNAWSSSGPGEREAELDPRAGGALPQPLEPGALDLDSEPPNPKNKVLLSGRPSHGWCILVRAARGQSTTGGDAEGQALEGVHGNLSPPDPGTSRGARGAQVAPATAGKGSKEEMPGGVGGKLKLKITAIDPSKENQTAGV